MNSIIINNIRIEDNRRILWSYEINGDWSIYFMNQRTSYAEYDVDLSSVPESILVIPFVCNILPAVWLCDATVYVDQIDESFFKHLEMIKDGYRNMYPMLSFKGSIKSKSIIINNEKVEGRTGCLFSGGLDAYTTFFRHYEERPSLLTIWGADIKLDDNIGWNNLIQQVEVAANQYGVGYHTIKSDFRSVMNENNLDRLVLLSNDKWWHGFQNSLSMISLASPVSFVEKWQKVYIASSFSVDSEGMFTGGSIPSIDNNLYFGGCRTVHDGYELNRQQKTLYLSQECKKRNQIPYLRVCWESTGGRNCSHCEKCYRTILGLVAEGEDPNSYGFVWNKNSIKRCKKDLTQRIMIYEYDYHPIQIRMIENAYKITDVDNYRWFMEVDLDSVNCSLAKRLRKTKLVAFFNRFRFKFGFHKRF